MKVIIDRFEGDFAICEKEDRTMVNIKKTDLPDGVREGDVLMVEDNKISIDQEETLARRNHIRKMMNNLWD